MQESGQAASPRGGSLQELLNPGFQALSTGVSFGHKGSYKMKMNEHCVLEKDWYE